MGEIQNADGGLVTTLLKMFVESADKRVEDTEKAADKRLQQTERIYEKFASQQQESLNRITSAFEEDKREQKRTNEEFKKAKDRGDCNLCRKPFKSSDEEVNTKPAMKMTCEECLDLLKDLGKTKFSREIRFACPLSTCRKCPLKADQTDGHVCTDGNTYYVALWTPPKYDEQSLKVRVKLEEKSKPPKNKNTTSDNAERENDKKPSSKIEIALPPATKSTRQTDDSAVVLDDSANPENDGTTQKRQLSEPEVDLPPTKKITTNKST